MAEVFKLDATEVDSLEKIMDEYEIEGIKIINDVLHDEGAKVIQNKIRALIPSSGRQWRKKRTPAKTAQPFKQTNGELSVTTGTETRYNYLYFPNDGSNTKRHKGDKRFFEEGNEAATDDIVSICLGRLEQNL
jgi:hypothetical protein